MESTFYLDTLKFASEDEEYVRKLICKYISSQSKKPEDLINTNINKFEYNAEEEMYYIELITYKERGIELNKYLINDYTFRTNGEIEDLSDSYNRHWMKLVYNELKVAEKDGLISSDFVERYKKDALDKINDFLDYDKLMRTQKVNGECDKKVKEINNHRNSEIECIEEDTENTREKYNNIFNI